jgi:hypothetical protein
MIVQVFHDGVLVEEYDDGQPEPPTDPLSDLTPEQIDAIRAALGL